MRKTAASLLVLMLAVLSLRGGTSLAQENNGQKAAEPRGPIPAYHLEFALNELEEGKKVNTRQYGMDLVALRQEDRGYVRDLARDKAIKIGTRVPIETEAGKVEYIDIGTSIRCQMFEDEVGLSLYAHAEISSLVARSDTDAYHPSTRDPILRQLSIESASAITPGKLTSLGTVDDPDSKRQFQLEVTVAKLR
jgi:hypothetical protein